MFMFFAYACGMAGVWAVLLWVHQVKARDGKDDVLNTLAAGTATGAIHQATGGAMAIARGSTVGTYHGQM